MTPPATNVMPEEAGIHASLQLHFGLVSRMPTCVGMTANAVAMRVAARGQSG
jgi:hypothetical protein